MTNNSPHPPPVDADFEQQVQKLYQLTIYRRWLFVGTCWLTLGTLSLWELRGQISLALEYFTWALVRYSIIYEPVPSFGLGFCVAIATAVLVWQSYNIIFGFSPEYRQHLERQVMRIRAAGQSHPLWKRVCQ